MRKNRQKWNDRLARILTKAVWLAEELFPESGQGPEKRAWVIDFINERVDVPGLNEKMEERLLGTMVDVVVALVINVAT